MYLPTYLLYIQITTSIATILDPLLYIVAHCAPLVPVFVDDECDDDQAENDKVGYGWEGQPQTTRARGQAERQREWQDVQRTKCAEAPTN